MNANVKYFDKNSKYMDFLVNQDEILEKYNEIQDKIKNLFNKKFDSEPVHNDKYIKAKVNLYDTNFYGNKTPIECKHDTCFCNIVRFYC